MDKKLIIRLILLRHGNTLLNEKRAYIGTTDESLSLKGISELKERKVKLLKNNIFNSPDIVFSGKLKRCIQTSEILFGDEIEPVIIDGLTEIDFGLFEGKNYEELSEYKEYQEWIDSNGIKPFPNGESKDDFTKRTLLAFDSLIGHIRMHKSDSLNKVKSVCILHGGNIMAILSSLTGEDYYSFQTGTGLGYQLTIECTNDSYELTDYIKLD